MKSLFFGKGILLSALVLVVAGCSSTKKPVQSEKLKLDIMGDRGGTLPPAYRTLEDVQRARRAASVPVAPAAATTTTEQPALDTPPALEQEFSFSPVQTVKEPEIARPKVIHTVAKGENLSGIARQYGVSMNAICKENGIANPNKIAVGTKLSIPEGGKSSVQTSAVVTGTKKTVGRKVATMPANGIYIVQPGDSFFLLVRDLKVKEADLKAWNPVLKRDPSRMRVGQKVYVTAAAAQKAGIHSSGSSTKKSAKKSTVPSVKPVVVEEVEPAVVPPAEPSVEAPAGEEKEPQPVLEEAAPADVPAAPDVPAEEKGPVAPPPSVAD